MMKEIFNTYIKQLQDTITSKLEAIDGKATFTKTFGNVQKVGW